MRLQVAALYEGAFADDAAERTLPGVETLVHVKRLRLLEGAATLRAHIRPHVGVSADVTGEIL